MPGRLTPGLLLRASLLPALSVAFVALPADVRAQDRADVLDRVVVRAQDRVVVLDRAEDRALVVHPVNGDVLASIPTGPEPREVVVSPDGRLAYVSSAGRAGGRRGAEAGSITVLDLEENRVKAVFRPGGSHRLNGIGLNRSGRRLWVASEAQAGILELDAGDGSLLMLWRTGGVRSHALTLTPDGRKLYVANGHSDSLSIIDRVNVVGHRVPTGAGPEGLDLSPDSGEVWVVNRLDNSITVVDARRETTVATLVSGGMEPVRIRFRPATEEAWVAHHRSRSIVIFDAVTREIHGRVRLPGAPLSVLFSPDGNRAFVALPELGEVAVVNAATREVEATFPAGSPAGMAWSHQPTAPATGAR